MKDFKRIVKSRLEDVAEMDAIEKILDMQKYPAEAEHYLETIERGSEKYGVLWVAVKAYCLGVIIGKREERRKNK